jgi:hypothetical protein
MRRYLLLPRSQSSLISSSSASSSNYSSAEEVAILEKEAIASINANANVLFGVRLHHHHHQKNNNSTLPSSNIIDESFSNNYNINDNDELYHNSQYSLACGTLLDIAKEDASINGQQVQALAALDGLCHWARRCLSNNGEGSAVLTGLIRGYTTYVDDDDNCGATTSLEEEEAEEEAFRNNNNSLNKSATTTTATTTTTSSSRRGKKRSVSIIESSSLEKSDEKQRQKILEAITAIATGKPRKGHSIIGAGTYRDGMIGWMALSREYALLSSSSSSSNVALTTAAIDYIVDDDYTNTTANPTFSSEEVKGGSREISLYKSRNGEVTKIEHLACTTPEYLAMAGGAMARIFFV